ncbi:MAG: sugar ABC transporter permease [Thermomicrobiales bacterium]
MSSTQTTRAAGPTAGSDAATSPTVAPLAGQSGAVVPVRQRRSLGDSRLGDYLLVLPAAIFILATVLYPVIYTINLSFYDVNIRNFLAGNAPFIGLDGYQTMLTDPAFQRAFVVSLLYTGGSLALTFFGGFALALLFNRVFLGANTMRALILLAWILPSVVSGNIWRWMLDGGNGVVNVLLMRLGLLGRPIFWLTESETALTGVVLATAWSSIPFAMVLLLAGLQGISVTLYEAASLDGAQPWRRFIDITLPLMRPVILVVLLLNFIYTFKTFDTVYIMTRGGPGDATTVLPIFAYTVGFSFFRLGEGAVATTLLLIIPLVLSLVYFRMTRSEEAA